MSRRVRPLFPCCLSGLIATVSLIGLVGCGPSGYQPIDTSKVLFWDRQTTETADLLRDIIAGFNEQQPGLPVEAQYSGGYSDIFRKVSSSIQARRLPAMAVAYESMTIEYAQAGAIVELDPFVADPEIGLDADDLADFFPVVLDTNRYVDADDKMLSFPFCKSVLMMYYNRTVLGEAGFEAPPATWKEFLAQCRAVKAATGKTPVAVDIDASTVDGMIYSMGGDVVRDGKTLFDAPESLGVFSLYETLAKEKLCYQIPPGSYDDRDAFAQDEIAFFFRSSSHRTYVADSMGLTDRWGMARIPQADPAQPRTVLYGPNVCVFRTNAEQERRAWEFVKHFTSPEVNVRWALNSGYLPIRRSAARDPRIQEFWAEWPDNRASYDCLEFARSEPNIAGWQEVRDLIETAVTGVLTGERTAEAAVQELKTKADAVISGRLP